MFSTYIKTCDKCNIEYISKSKKRIKKFTSDNNNLCPKCGGYLSQVPLMRFRLTPPPELKKIERKIETIKI